MQPCEGGGGGLSQVCQSSGSGLSQHQAVQQTSANMARLLPPPAVISQRRVVVTGLGAVTPLANGVQASWERLLDGRCGVRQLKPSSTEAASVGHSKVCGWRDDGIVGAFSLVCNAAWPFVCLKAIPCVSAHSKKQLCFIAAQQQQHVAWCCR